MGDVQRAVTFLRRTYPLPEPDPAWVGECVAALRDDGQPATVAAVHEQYLYNDLGASTLPLPRGRGIPTSTDEHDSPRLESSTLFATPTIVQLHTLSEVGASAFALSTTLDQRRDVITGATRIRRLGDEDDQDGEAGVADGVPPPYPRSMLAMDVSDGRTAMRAFEYRRIPELVLSETQMGTKLLLHNVRCLRGTLLLDPSNTTVVGGAVEALDAGQPEAFVASLQARLDAAKDGSATAAATGAGARPRTLQARGRGSGSGRGRAAPAPAPARGPAARAAQGGTSAAGRAARLAAMQAAREEEAAAAEATAHEPFDLTGDTTIGDTTIGDDMDDDEFDDSFLREIDAAEAQATTSQRRAAEAARTRARGTRREADIEIIEISD